MDKQANEEKEVEIISAEIHKCYCRAYERRFGKPYWTNGDYSKLDEPTKNYDREMAIWHIANRAPATPLVDLDRQKIDVEIETIIHGIRAFASYGIGARIYGEGVDDIHLQRAISSAVAIRKLCEELNKGEQNGN